MSDCIICKTETDRRMHLLPLCGNCFLTVDLGAWAKARGGWEQVTKEYREELRGNRDEPK